MVECNAQTYQVWGPCHVHLVFLCYCISRKLRECSLFQGENILTHESESQWPSYRLGLLRRDDSRSLTQSQLICVIIRWPYIQLHHGKIMLFSKITKVTFIILELIYVVSLRSTQLVILSIKATAHLLHIWFILDAKVCVRWIHSSTLGGYPIGLAEPFPKYVIATSLSWLGIMLKLIKFGDPSTMNWCFYTFSYRQCRSSVCNSLLLIIQLVSTIRIGASLFVTTLYSSQSRQFNSLHSFYYFIPQIIASPLPLNVRWGN